MTPGLYDYYLNVASLNDYAEFHYVFVFGTDQIDYRYRKKQSLLYEKPSLNGDMLFEYDYSKKRGNMGGIKALAPTLNWAFQTWTAS